MEMDKFKTKVIFRKWQDGQIIALFPEILADSRMNMLSYMHMGQHGAAAYDLLLNCTKLATENEYSDLLSELESTGYDLQIVKRETQKMRDARYDEYIRTYR